MGENGIGVHIRNSGTATIGGTVGDLTASSTTAGRGVYATAGTLILDETGVVKNCTMMNAVYVSGCRDGLSTVLRGTVSGNTLGGDNGYAVVIENSDATFASTSVIENNNSKIATVYAPAGAKIELYGKFETMSADSAAASSYMEITPHTGTSRLTCMTVQKLPAIRTQTF